MHGIQEVGGSIPPSSTGTYEVEMASPDRDLTVIEPYKCGACGENTVGVADEVCDTCIQSGLEDAARAGWLDPEPGEVIH